jgi:hypothetical protein
MRIYKKYRFAVRNISESITVSDSVSWNLEKEPIGEVTRAGDAKDYYKAISCLAHYFKTMGKKFCYRSIINPPFVCALK